MSLTFQGILKLSSIMPRVIIETPPIRNQLGVKSYIIEIKIKIAPKISPPICGFIFECCLRELGLSSAKFFPKNLKTNQLIITTEVNINK